MNGPVKVAFASCLPDAIESFVQRFASIAPDVELLVVSEFPASIGKWIPWRVDRPARDNRARVAAALAGRTVRYGAIVLQPGAPYTSLRLTGLLFSGRNALIYNRNLDHFTLHPRSLPGVAGHLAWRLREVARFQTRPGGDVYTWLWRLRHPRELRRPLDVTLAHAAGERAARHKARSAPALPALSPESSLPEGISVVIPSRNGRTLLQRLLPTIHGRVAEIIVVDNGSDDGTAEFLRSNYPDVCIESSAAPLSFARAVNRGIRAARYSHVALLNNDMVPEPDFFPALREAFRRVPDLFCATAQIFFPEGKRREETGKAVMHPIARVRTTTEFPVYCVEPLPGEDLTWVLYGSGGCSLYDTQKLRALGGIGEIYEPAYVEDLDAGVQAWRRGWPTVFVAGARTVHDHRATTSRYYSEDELNRVLERNYLRFLLRSIGDPGLFRTLWKDAIDRLNRKAVLEQDAGAALVLGEARREARSAQALPPSALPEEEVLALGSGDVAVFPGGAPRRDRTVVIATCYAPFPLSHGGAVRMYNLMRRAARDGYGQVLVTFVDELGTPPAELLEICTEVVQVRRKGRHSGLFGDRGLPDAVEDFESPAFRTALRLSVSKWSAQIVQLEFTQMAQYAPVCRPARTILVEHDVTIDLYRQLLSLHPDDYDLRQQLQRWTQFETRAWSEVDSVVTMSARDQQSVTGARATTILPNGVDLHRFQPGQQPPEEGRLLFIGSFNHLPNLLALDYFLRDIWPLLAAHCPTLHVIAGARHRYYYDRWRDRVSFRLDHPGLELEDFVVDVREAYRRAAVVIAPLLASAGTNIKIMEAMAMGKAIVSTPGGVNGLDELTASFDVMVEGSPAGFAAAVVRLLSDPERRAELGRNARETAARRYSWETIATKQKALYESLIRS